MTKIPVPNAGPRRSASGRILRALMLLIVLAACGITAWTWLMLKWSYSEGERAGVLQKFSTKGWLCKTSEGELAQYIVLSMAPQIWEFSVRDPATADALRKAVGHKVQLHYTDHPGLPNSCFGDTRYFVDRVEITDNVPTAIPVPGPAVPAPTAAPAPAPGPAP
jgi:hypothetical protein